MLKVPLPGDGPAAGAAGAVERDDFAKAVVLVGAAFRRVGDAAKLNIAKDNAPAQNATIVRLRMLTKADVDTDLFFMRIPLVRSY